MISDKIFEISIYLVLHFLLVCTSFNHILDIRDRASHPPPPVLVGGRGMSSMPPSLISRDFRSNFSCSIFFFLLASCFLFLHFKALQIVLLTSSCGAGRREIRRFVGGRV